MAKNQSGNVTPPAPLRTRQVDISQFARKEPVVQGVTPTKPWTVPSSDKPSSGSK
jgi:hypothetical protein